MGGWGGYWEEEECSFGEEEEEERSAESSGTNLPVPVNNKLTAATALNAKS